MAIDEARSPLSRQLTRPPPKPQKPHWAFTAIGIATVLGLCYWGELVLAVMLVSVLLAFILAPVMEFLIRLHLPRGLAAAVAVILLLACWPGWCTTRRTRPLFSCTILSKYTQTDPAGNFSGPATGENPGNAGPGRSSQRNRTTSQHQLGRPPDPRLRFGLASFAGSLVRSFPGVFHAELAASCPLRDGDAFLRWRTARRHTSPWD